MRPVRALGVAAVFVACCGLLSGGVHPARGAVDRTEPFYVTYTGHMVGHEAFYGFVSVTKPYAHTYDQNWTYHWIAKCRGTVTVSDVTGRLAPGAQLYCTGRARIGGWESEHYVNRVAGQVDCTGDISSASDAVWGMGGFVRSHLTMRLAAAPPDVYTTVPSPAGSGCTGPDEAIHWERSPDILYTGPVAYTVHVKDVGLGKYISSSPKGQVQRGAVDSESELTVTFG